MVEKYLEEAIAYYNIAKFQLDSLKKNQRLLEYNTDSNLSYKEKAKLADKVTKNLYEVNMAKSIEALNKGATELEDKVMDTLSDIFKKSNNSKLSFRDTLIKDFEDLEVEFRTYISFYKKATQLLSAYINNLRYPMRGVEVNAHKMDPKTKLDFDKDNPLEIVSLLVARLDEFVTYHKGVINKILTKYKRAYDDITKGDGTIRGIERYKDNIVSKYNYNKPLCDIKGYFTLEFFYNQVRGLADSVNIYEIGQPPL